MNRLILLFFAVFSLNTNAQSILIDDFSTNQSSIFAIGPGATEDNTATTVGADILAGERDIQVRVVSGSFASGEVNGGRFIFSMAGGANGRGLLVYDGNDGNGSTIDFTGLGGIDLTGGGTADAINVEVESSDETGTLVVTVYSDATNFSTATQAIPVLGPGSNVRYSLLVSSFVVGGGTGADFSNIGAISVSISGTSIDINFNEISVSNTPTSSPDVPTLSQWGLVILALMFMTLGTLHILQPMGWLEKRKYKHTEVK